VFTVRFGSVFIKKSNQTEFIFFKKKLKSNRNRFKPTGFGSARLGFLEQKPVWLGFFGLARFFSGFFQFGSSGSKLKKPKPNRTGRFFQKFNRFFSRFGFFGYFFFWFSRFNRFFGFFEHP
jgi:hypothetical protein